jgi:hypothetical protein
MHRWADSKWLERASQFLQSILGSAQSPDIKTIFSDFEVAATVILLYHRFGPSYQSYSVDSEGRKVKPMQPPRAKDTLISQALGDEGMRVFKHIFDTNSKELIIAFFNHSLILKLWPRAILPNLTKEICFKGSVPKISILNTYSFISMIMTKTFNL